MKSITLLLFITLSFAQNRFANVEIKVHPVKDHVYYLQGAGGNIGLTVGEDGVIMIDDQFAPLTDKIVAAIETLSDKPIRFLINTHMHGDHTGGNENFGKRGVTIIAHDLVREHMSKDEFSKRRNRMMKAKPKAALPVVTFNESITFHVNGDEIEVFHIPNAHTDGDAIIHFKKANVFHMGDTFFHNRYPFIDVEGGGSIYGAIEVQKAVLAKSNADSKIIPGHGSLTDRQAIADYLVMLETTMSAIKKLKDSGKSLEQTIAAKPTAEFDDRYNSDSNLTKRESFISYVYASLK